MLSITQSCITEGDHIKVTASKYPFPTVCADRASTDWFQSISRTLKWNERERQKSFVVVEENPVAAEEGPDDGFDIDVVEDNGFKSTNDREIPGGGSDSSKDSNVAEGDSPGMRQAHETMLQPEEAALGREKAREGARDDGARLQVSAERAARALAYVNPALRHAPSGPAQSGISSPDRYLHARHVAFTGGPRSAGAPAPRAFRTAERGRDAVGRLRADELRTPTVGDPTRNRLHAAAAPTRSRSMEVRRQHPRAFAVWGHDDSESEGATSEDEM
jgi:NAD+ kinase